MDKDTLEAAVAAGVVDARTRDALLRFAAARESGGDGAQDPDNERFRLLTGFNDIFVTVACALVLVAVGALLPGAWAKGLGVAAAAWGLAEYWTRVRRVALTSIVLLLAFVGGVFAAVIGAAEAAGALAAFGPDSAPGLWWLAGAGAAAGLAALLHWRRFRVPITVAAGAGAVALTLGLLLERALGLQDDQRGLWLAFAAGLAIFALAMRFDASDTARVTRRADVAFWLHLLAAPLIIHPVFVLTGLASPAASPGAAAVVLAVYAALVAVALVIDRRALLVSALAYVLYAINALVAAGGNLAESFGLTALVLGGGLVLLSAAWAPLRRRVLGLAPDGLRQRVPAA